MPGARWSARNGGTGAKIRASEQEMASAHGTNMKGSPVIGKVFVSHSSTDKPFVDRLVADLMRHAIPVWYDKFDLNVGDSVPGSLNEALGSAKYFAIVLSRAAVESSWVREEL